MCLGSESAAGESAGLQCRLSASDSGRRSGGWPASRLPRSPSVLASQTHSKHAWMFRSQEVAATWLRKSGGDEPENNGSELSMAALEISFKQHRNTTFPLHTNHANTERQLKWLCQPQKELWKVEWNNGKWACPPEVVLANWTEGGYWKGPEPLRGHRLKDKTICPCNNAIYFFGEYNLILFNIVNITSYFLMTVSQNHTKKNSWWILKMCSHVLTDYNNLLF